jgi:hypothetical protein
VRDLKDEAVMISFIDCLWDESCLPNLEFGTKWAYSTWFVTHYCFNDEKQYYERVIRTNSPIQLPFHSTQSRILLSNVKNGTPLNCEAFHLIATCPYGFSAKERSSIVDDIHSLKADEPC